MIYAVPENRRASPAIPMLSVEEVLREVDAALYAAKEAGRNCCKLAKPTHQQKQFLP